MLSYSPTPHAESLCAYLYWCIKFAIYEF